MSLTIATLKGKAWKELQERRTVPYLAIERAEKLERRVTQRRDTQREIKRRLKPDRIQTLYEGQDVHRKYSKASANVTLVTNYRHNEGKAWQRA